jgi:catechol 2,3-dioxygenase-like lactoylglutathione lyase family enzyme
MPKLDGLLQCSLYVESLERARKFYEEVLELKPLLADGETCVYAIVRDTLVLLERGLALAPLETIGASLPPRDAHGPAHVAFAIVSRELSRWEAQLAKHGVAIESRVRWPRGGHSIYFRDPDRNLLELTTPGSPYI